MEDTTIRGVCVGVSGKESKPYWPSNCSICPYCQCTQQLLVWGRGRKKNIFTSYNKIKKKKKGWWEGAAKLPGIECPGLLLTPRLKQEKAIEEIIFLRGASYLIHPIKKCKLFSLILVYTLCEVQEVRVAELHTLEGGDPLFYSIQQLFNTNCAEQQSHMKKHTPVLGDFPVLSPRGRLTILQVVHFWPKPSKLYSSKTTSKTTSVWLFPRVIQKTPFRPLWSIPFTRSEGKNSG